MRCRVALKCWLPPSKLQVNKSELLLWSCQSCFDVFHFPPFICHHCESGRSRLVNQSKNHCVCLPDAWRLPVLELKLPTPLRFQMTLLGKEWMERRMRFLFCHNSGCNWPSGAGSVSVLAKHGAGVTARPCRPNACSRM